MGLAGELATVVEAASRFADEGEALEGVIPAEPVGGERVYLCSYANGSERRWLALDEAGRPLNDRRLVRDTVAIAAMCELAEESAGGGDVETLRASLADLRLTENPLGIEEAEAAAADLADALRPPPRVASTEYLDTIGAAAAKLERALGDHGSPFAEAMKVGAGAAEELTEQVERGYKHPFQNEALSSPARTGRRDSASSDAPLASGYERDAASLPRTPQHEPCDESSS